MRWRPTRFTDRPDLQVMQGERLLASASAGLLHEDESTTEVTIGGTRDAFYLPERVPWEQIKAANWDRDTELLRVSEIGEWGRPRAIYQFTLVEPGRLLQLVRERISASVVLQRHVPVVGKRGFRLIARRPPGRSLEVSWFFEYDEGVDPQDPAIAAAADEALRVAQSDIPAS